MPLSEAPDPVAVATRRLQLIVGVMVVGQVVFLAVAALLRGRGGPDVKAASDALPVVTVVAFVATGTVFPLSLIVPGVIADAARRRIAARPPGPAGPGAQGEDATADLVGVYQARTIAGAAMTDGIALFATAAYFLEGKSYGLALAVVLAAATALWFPRRGDAVRWIEDQLERINDRRRMAG
jgi:hypothetical protein